MRLRASLGRGTARRERPRRMPGAAASGAGARRGGRRRWCAIDFELTGLDPERGRDHLVRRDSDRARPRAARRGRVRARPAAGRDRARTRSASTASAPPTSTRRPPLADAIEPLLRGDHRPGARRPHRRRRAGVPRSRAARVRACGCGRRSSTPRCSGVLWLHERDGGRAPADVARRARRGARAAGRPTARRARRRADDRAGVHRARGAPRRDAPETVGSLARARSPTRDALRVFQWATRQRDRRLARLQTGDLARDARRRGHPRCQPVLLARSSSAPRSAWRSVSAGGASAPPRGARRRRSRRPRSQSRRAARRADRLIPRQRLAQHHDAEDGREHRDQVGDGGGDGRAGGSDDRVVERVGDAASEDAEGEEAAEAVEADVARRRARERKQRGRASRSRRSAGRLRARSPLMARPARWRRV